MAKKKNWDDVVTDPFEGPTAADMRKPDPFAGPAAAAPRGVQPWSEAQERTNRRLGVVPQGMEFNAPQAAPALSLGALAPEGSDGADMQAVAQYGATRANARRAIEAAQNRGIVSLPPETVEATRLPPVVEGIMMRRGAPGSGQSGQRLDLTAVPFERAEPMTYEQAQAQGMIIQPYQQPQTMTYEQAVEAGIMKPQRPAFRFKQIGQAPGGPNAGMGMTTDGVNRAAADATRGERWGRGGPTSGINRRADAIIDMIRGQQVKREDADTALRGAQGTPQAVSGYGGVAAYTPGTEGKAGRWDVQAAERGASGGARPMTAAQAANVMRQASALRAGNLASGIKADPETADMMESLLIQQGFDVAALRAQSGAGVEKQEGGRMKDEGRGRKTGDVRVVNGVRYVRGSDGKLYREKK
jgi:hypothetical protein